MDAKDKSITRAARFRAELRAARCEAREAHRELARALAKPRCPLRDLAAAATRAKFAAARLYTAAACILSPP